MQDMTQDQNTQADVLERIFAGADKKTTDAAPRPGCYGTIAFNDDERCRKCDAYQDCAAIDRSGAYSMVEEELIRLASEFQLEEELSALKAMLDTTVGKADGEAEEPSDEPADESKEPIEADADLGADEKAFEELLDAKPTPAPVAAAPATPAPVAAAPAQKPAPAPVAPRASGPLELDLNKIKIRSKVLDFDLDEAIIAIVEKRLPGYKDSFEVMREMSQKPEIISTLYSIFGKVLIALQDQGLLSFDPKDKAAGIRWNI